VIHVTKGEVKMFKLTIEGNTVAELKTKLQAALQEFTGGAAVSTPAKPAAAAAPKAPAKPATPDFKEEVAPLILKLAEKGREKVMAVFSTFGVAKGSELKPEQYAEAIAALNTAITAAEAADELT